MSSLQQQEKEEDSIATLYLDYNATTPVDPNVIKTITESLTHKWGNPSSAHEAGKEAKVTIDNARQHVAAAVSAMSPDEIVFTSGGTEANNWVIQSAVERWTGSTLPHIIISEIEHDSILKPCLELQQHGKITLTVVSVGYNGLVLVSDIIDAISQSTCLISIMLAHNETGILQPIAKIAAAVKSIGNQSILLHSDVAQAIGKVPVSVCELGVDFATIVGHKFYGPRIGALWCRKLGSLDGVPLHPLLFGGGQERGYRSGTENTAMIAGLGHACLIVANNVIVHGDHMKYIRDYFERTLARAISPRRVIFFGSDEYRLPNTSFFAIESPELAQLGGGRHLLKLASSINASVGAACHSGNVPKPSRVLQSMGTADLIAINAVRISVGRDTSIENMEHAVYVITEALNKILL